MLATIGILHDDDSDKFKLWEQQCVTTACRDTFKRKVAAPFFVTAYLVPHHNIAHEIL